MEIDKKVVRFMVDPYEDFAYCTGFVLRGYTVKVKEETYLLVVKATSRLQGQIVAFIECKTLYECFSYLHDYCWTKAAPLKWRPDRFG